jgi:hypothetical protein
MKNNSFLNYTDAHLSTNNGLGVNTVHPGDIDPLMAPQHPYPA